MSRVQVPSLTPTDRAPDPRERVRGSSLSRDGPGGRPSGARDSSRVTQAGSARGFLGSTSDGHSPSDGRDHHVHDPRPSDGYAEARMSLVNVAAIVSIG